MSQISFITDIGKAKLAQADLSGQKSRIAQFAVGSGDAFNDLSRNSLVNEFYRAPIDGVNPVPGNNDMTEASVFVPPTVGAAVYRELGLFDKDGDMIAVYKTTHVDVSDDDFTQFRWLLPIEYSRAAEIIIQSDPHIGTASRQYVDDSLTPLMEAQILTMLTAVTQAHEAFELRQMRLQPQQLLPQIIREDAAVIDDGFKYIAGGFYPTLIDSSTQLLDYTLSLHDRLFLVPFVPAADMRITRIGFKHRNDHEDAVDVGIYNQAGELLTSGQNAEPHLTVHYAEVDPVTLIKGQFYHVAVRVVSGVEGASVTDESFAGGLVPTPTLKPTLGTNSGNLNDGVVLYSDATFNALPEAVDLNGFRYHRQSPYLTLFNSGA